jgi:hypothetical protein
VDAVALDEKCVYWAEHEPGAGTVTFRARAR